MKKATHRELHGAIFLNIESQKKECVFAWVNTADLLKLKHSALQ